MTLNEIKEINEIKEVMIENIQKALNNNVKLTELTEKTEILLQDSQKFINTSKKVENELWYSMFYKKIKYVSVVIASGVILLTILVI